MDGNDPDSRIADLKSRGLVEAWLSRNLGCLPGRREFHRGRLECHIIRDLDAGRRAYASLLSQIQAHQATGGLFLFPDIPSGKDTSVAETFSALLRGVSQITGTPWETGPSPTESFDAGRLGVSLILRCPVTRSDLEFHDFDFVAFCPQAVNEHDPCYNPSLEAPAPIINFSSDLFGFSMLTRDICLQQHGCAPHQLSDENARNRVFDHAVRVWQQLAVKTLRMFASRTNPRLLCPLHVNSPETHWISPHPDSSFATLARGLHIQEMPLSYAPRLVERWRRWFADGAPFVLDGVNVPEIHFRSADS